MCGATIRSEPTESYNFFLKFSWADTGSTLEISLPVLATTLKVAFRLTFWSRIPADDSNTKCSQVTLPFARAFIDTAPPFEWPTKAVGEIPIFSTNSATYCAYSSNPQASLG